MWGMLAVLIVIFSSASAAAQDAAKVDSDHYKVEFENDEVRILRIHYDPGEKSVMHEHPDGVVVFLTEDGKTKFTLPDGTTQETTSSAGVAVWSPAGKHLPENSGDKPVEAILIELKCKTKMTASKVD